MQQTGLKDNSTFINLKKKAKSLGASDFGYSQAKNKRFYVIYQGHIINFGLKGGSTFIDHNDENKRKAWRARHSKIVNSDNIPAHLVKSQSSYWSWNLLW